MEETRFFFGREHEQAELFKVIRSANNSHGILFYIKGEVGTGKTYLVENFLDGIEDQIEIIRIRGIEYLKDDAYFGLRMLLRSIWRIEETSEENLTEVIDNFFNSNVIISFIKPYIKWFLKLPLNEREQFIINNLQDSDKQDMALGSVINLIKYISHEKTLVIFIDDLHFLDRSTSVFIRYLSHEIKNRRILGIFTSLPEFNLEKEFNITRIDEMILTNFTKSETGEYIAASEDCEKVDPKLIDFIYKRCKGNPLFIFEFMALIREKEFLKREDNTLTLQTTFSNIPNKVSQIILSRYNYLKTPYKKLLKKGSIFGNEFSDLMLTKMSGDVDLNIFLDYLVEKKFIEKSQHLAKESEGENIYRFCHTSIRDIIYNTMAPDERSIYHKVAGEVFEREFSGIANDNLNIMIHHFKKGNVKDKYITYLLQSAKEKVQDFELSEAESSFMQLLDEGVKTSEVYKGLGDVYFKLEEYKKALDYYNEIFELSDGDEALTIDSEISRINVLIKLARFNDAQQKIIQVEKLVEDKSVYLKQYINILDIKGNLMLIQGILDIAEEYFNKSLETKLKHYGDLNLKVADSYNNLGIIYRKKNKLKLAEEYILKALDIKKEFLGENHPEIAEVYNSLALVYWTANDLEKAEDFLTISIEIKKMIFGEGQVSLAKGYVNLGALYWKKQNYIEAEEFYKNALCILKNAFGEEHSNVAVCYYNLGLLYFITDDLNDAELNTKKALALCLLIYGEVHPETAKANNTLGLIYLSRNELNEAEILEKKALDIYENIYGHDDAFLIDAIINIAETLSKKSEFDQAKEYLDRAAKLIEKLNEEDFPIYYFRLNYLLGLYYKAKGEEDLLSTTISNAKRVVEKIKSVPLYPMLKKQVEEFLEEHV